MATLKQINLFFWMKVTASYIASVTFILLIKSDIKSLNCLHQSDT